jgi:hypothetical protein
MQNSTTPPLYIPTSSRFHVTPYLLPPPINPTISPTDCPAHASIQHLIPLSPGPIHPLQQPTHFNNPPNPYAPNPSPSQPRHTPFHASEPNAQSSRVPAEHVARLRACVERAWQKTMGPGRWMAWRVLGRGGWEGEGEWMGGRGLELGLGLCGRCGVVAVGRGVG